MRPLRCKALFSVCQLNAPRVTKALGNRIARGRPALGEAVARRVASALQSHESVRRSTFGDALRVWLRRAGGPLPAPGGQRAAWAVLITELCIPRQAAAVRSQRLKAALDIALDPQTAVDRGEAIADVLEARSARRLSAAAEAIIARHGGCIPREESLLRGLPGIGAQTAAVIRSFGFGERTVLAREGARRVVRRVTGLPVSSIWTSRLELLRLAGPAGPDVSFNVALVQLAEALCTQRVRRADTVQSRRSAGRASAEAPAANQRGWLHDYGDRGRRELTTAAIRLAASAGSSCSQTRMTTHPSERSASSTRRSRWTLARSLGAQ